MATKTRKKTKAEVNRENGRKAKRVGFGQKPINSARVTAAFKLTREQQEELRKKKQAEEDELFPEVKEQRSAGAPRVGVFDKHQFEQLCQLQCTQEEIAAFFRMSIATLHTRVIDEYETDSYVETYKVFARLGNIALRTAQLKNAVKHNSTAMQIFLGKNNLGQSDMPQGNAGVDPDKVQVYYDIREALYEEGMRKYPETDLAIVPTETHPPTVEGDKEPQPENGGASFSEPKPENTEPLPNNLKGMRF